MEGKGLPRSFLYFSRNPNVFKFLFFRLYVVNSHLVERGYLTKKIGRRELEREREDEGRRV